MADPPFDKSMIDTNEDSTLRSAAADVRTLLKSDPRIGTPDTSQVQLPDRLTLQPDDELDTAGRKILLRELLRALFYEQIAVEGIDTEGVHKMRVSFRRMHTALVKFRPFYSQPLKLLQAQVKQVRDIFGRVRDFDVLMIAYQEYSPTPQDSIPSPPLWGSLHEKNYRLARQAMLAMLSSREYEYLIGRLYLFGSGKPDHYTPSFQTINEPKNRLNHILPSLLKNQLKQIDSFQEFSEHTPYNEFHALRIEAKKFRYMIEFFSEILDPAATGSMLLDLVALQDHLGKLNDAVIISRILDGYFPQTSIDRIVHSLTEFQHSRETVVKELTSTFQPAWIQFSRSNPDLRLDQMLTPLTSL